MSEIDRERNIQSQANASLAKARMENSRPATRGLATQFTNQYNAGLRMYPSDLMDPMQTYAGNYVVFYINVHEESTLLRNGSAKPVSGNIPNRTKGFISGQQLDQKSAGATAIAINTLGGGAGGAIGSSLGIGNITSGLVVGSVVSGLATTATINEIGKIKTEYKRIDQAIALYMPIDLNISYSVNWAEDDMAGAGALLGMGENAVNAISSAAKGGGIENLKNQFGAALNTASAFTAGVVLDNTPIGRALSKTSGVASNPKREQVFKNVDHRTFTFSYQFFSRSPEEAQQIRDIITLFKMHMHPEYKSDTGNFLYLYPSEFDIFYYNNGKENMNLHRHTSCVLTNMNIQYTPMGQYNSFADGMPTMINITLTFRELALLSKELIADGF